MKIYSYKKACLFIVCLFWITDVEAQNFPDLNFSVQERHEFEVSKTHQLDSGHTATELISRLRTVEGKNIIKINHIDLNDYSVTTEEFLNSYKSDYSRQGIKSVIQEINGIKYIIYGEASNFAELQGTDNYFMIATTFQNGDAYSIMVFSTIKDQVDWVFRIAEEIKFY